MDITTNLDNKEKEINTSLSVCQKVKETVETKGWIDIIGPELDKMIVNCVGGKVGDRWYYGDISAADTNTEYYIGYKHALIKLHNLIYNQVDGVARKQSDLEHIANMRARVDNKQSWENSRYATD